MRIHVGVLTGSLLISYLCAQSNHPVITEAQPSTIEEMRAQTEFEMGTLINQASQRANQTAQPLLATRASIPQKFTECSTQNTSDLVGAERQASGQKSAAQQQMVNGATSALQPLLNSAVTSTGVSAAEAEKKKKAAIDRFNTDFRNLGPQAVQCGISTTEISSDGGNAADVAGDLNSATSFLAAGGGAANPQCAQTRAALSMSASSAERTVRDMDEAIAKSKANKLALLGAGAGVGISWWSANNAKKGADATLAQEKSLAALKYGNCIKGVQAELAEIDRQLGNINAQLNNDIAMLNRQLANKKWKISPGSLNRPGNEFKDDGPQIGTLSGANIASNNSDLSNKADPFAKLAKGDGPGGGGDGSGGGGGAQANSGDSKPSWGFNDPNATSNPLAGQRLPDQPNAAMMMGGADSAPGGGSGAAFDPFANLMGFEDPFANMGAQTNLMVELGGNGFFELAMKTTRRIIAHRHELWANPTAPVTAQKDSLQSPERKTASTRN